MSTPIVVDVAAGNSRTIRNGSIGCGLVGVFFVVVGVIAAVNRSTAAAIVVGLLGLVVLVLGVYPLLRPEAFLRQRRLVVDAEAIRWDDPKGEPWTLRWDELSAVEIFTSGPRDVRMLYAARRTDTELVGIDLYPRGDVVRPEMTRLWQLDGVIGGWRLPLGTDPDLVLRLDHALQTFDNRGVYRRRAD